MNIQQLVILSNINQKFKKSRKKTDEIEFLIYNTFYKAIDKLNNSNSELDLRMFRGVSLEINKEHPYNILYIKKEMYEENIPNNINSLYKWANNKLKN